jgi:S1-C subfamily serine protease
MRRGDICLEFQGQEITGPMVLIRNIAAEEIGREIALTILRNGERMELRVRVSRRPG